MINTFILATGKTVQKDAKRCVAIKTRGRWHHKFFKSYDGAWNELRSVRAHLSNPDMVAYYGLEECKLIKPEANDFRSLHRQSFSPILPHYLPCLQLL